jgi:hypothetical protein
MYLVGKVKTVYTDGPSWDPVRLCLTKRKAIRECLTEAHFYVKIGFGQLPDETTAIHPRLVTR